ncbi:MAG: hypothetical protein Q7S22_05080 [Candidatus Micrarchaeota archaeon]|nr:hypothetical protein [Candidatus Micrarchaeota archaeon]
MQTLHSKSITVVKRAVAAATTVATVFFSQACVLHDKPDDFNGTKVSDRNSGIGNNHTNNNSAGVAIASSTDAPFSGFRTQDTRPETQDGGTDGGSDVGPARDSGPETRDGGAVDAGSIQDAGQETGDAGPITDGGSTADGGIPQPTCYVSIKSLIGETVDRTLEDRGIGESEYYLSTPETSSTANPFSDGQGGYIGQNTTTLYKISGDSFVPFSSVILVDNASGHAYQEEQNLWVSAESAYRDADDQITVRFRDIIYQLKFTSDAFGIPVCDNSANGSWANCESFGDNATSNHRAGVIFLGEKWLITGMDISGVGTVDNETQVKSGGSVELSKEFTGGRVNVGGSIDAGNGFKVRLDDVISEIRATISLIDAINVVVAQSTIATGSTQNLTLDNGGTQILIRTFKISPGDPATAWADLSILSDQITLRDGDSTIEVNGEREHNQDWIVTLGWRNKDLGSDLVDHLKSILVYRNVSTDWMVPGSGVNILSNPFDFSLTYLGTTLDRSNSNDYDTLSVTSEHGGFNFRPDGSVISTFVNASSYLTIRSSVHDAFSSLAGTGSKLVILFDNGQDRNVPLETNPLDSGFPESPQLKPGTVLLQLDSGRYSYVGSVNQGGLGSVDYFTAGEGGTIEYGGVIAFGYGDQGLNNVIGFDFSATNEVQTSNSFVVLISEDAGKGLSAGNADVLAFNYDIANASLNRDSPNGRYAQDKAYYVPVSTFSGLPELSFMDSSGTREINFVTDRGSILASKGESSFTVHVARRPAEVEMVLTEPICR